MYVLCVLLSHNESQTLAYPLRPRSRRSFRRITLRSGDARERRTRARERASDDEEKMTTMTTVASVVARRGADRATTTNKSLSFDDGADDDGADDDASVSLSDADALMAMSRAVHGAALIAASTARCDLV